MNEVFHFYNQIDIDFVISVLIGYDYLTYVSSSVHAVQYKHPITSVIRSGFRIGTQNKSTSPFAFISGNLSDSDFWFVPLLDRF